MRIRWLSAYALLVMAAVGWTAASPQAQEPKRGGTLVVAMDAEADFLDNQAAGGWITWRVNRNMFDTLLMEDLTVADADVPPIIPGLAERWEVSEDGLEYTFFLREGVKFHDGTELTAETVEWNIRRMWDESAPQYSAKAASCTGFSWQALKEIEIVDTYTIKLIQERPFGEFIGKLVDGGCGNTSLMSPTNWEKWGNDEIGEHPVGTGPFKFVERVRGEKIVLERFEDYWGDKLDDPRYKAPYVDRIIFRPMTDSAARVAALQAGEVDVVWSPPPDSLETMKTAGFKVASGPTPHVIYMTLNMREKCLGDVKIRQAINYAIDRVGMAQTLLQGAAQPAYGMIVPGSPSFDPDFEPYPYDPAKAKQLIANSSCPEPPEMNFLVPTGGSGNMAPLPIAQWMQRNLNDVGFDINLETYEWQTYLSFWWRGMKEDQHAYWMSWGMTTPFWMEVFAHSKWQAPGGSNVGWYDGEEADALLDQALVELDDAKRYDLYAEVNEIVMSDAVQVPLVHSNTPVLLGPNVEGYVHAPQNWMDFRTVWLSD